MTDTPVPIEALDRTPEPPIASPSAEPDHVADDVADGVEHRLDPRYITLQRITGSFSALLSAAIWLLAAWVVAREAPLAPSWRGAPYLAWAVYLVGSAIWTFRKPAIAWRNASYRIDEHGIEIRRGIFWRSVHNVPRSRVQHTDVSQGPLERRYSLGTLAIHTAGVAHSRIRLSGIEHGRALRIRDSLLPRERADVV